MLFVNRIVIFIEFGPCPIYAHGAYLSPNAGEIMMMTMKTMMSGKKLKILSGT